MQIHDHGDVKHAHVDLNDEIICAACSWKGRVSECKSKSGIPFITSDLYRCPNKRFYFFPCNTPLVIHDEEGGLMTLEKVRLP
jgi:hypothetical protein